MFHPALDNIRDEDSILSQIHDNPRLARLIDLYNREAASLGTMPIIELNAPGRDLKEAITRIDPLIQVKLLSSYISASETAIRDEKYHMKFKLFNRFMNWTIRIVVLVLLMVFVLSWFERDVPGSEFFNSVFSVFTEAFKLFTEP